VAASLLPLPGVRDEWRAAAAAVGLALGPVCVALGHFAVGIALSLLAALLISRRRVRAVPGWDSSGARWAPASRTEVDRLHDLLERRAAWARDPWHLGSGRGVLVFALCALAACGFAAAALLTGGPEAGIRLLAACTLALLPAFVMGGRAAAEPEDLGADLDVVRDVLDESRRAPEASWQPVPELLLADAADGRAVPAGARLRLRVTPDTGHVVRAWIEHVAGGARAVFHLRGSDQVRAILTGLSTGFAVASGPNHLQVTLEPGEALLERVTTLADALASA
jgi:hypothetical protein